MSKALQKYLALRAEPEIHQSFDLTFPYDQSLIIPAYGENEDLQRCLASVPQTGNTLVIVVLNARADSPHWVHENNQKARHFLKQWPHLLLIDRAKPDSYLPEKQGVGLARKIGGDIALQLWSEAKIKSPYFYCSDADVIFPKDYFERIPQKSTAAAFVFPFEHFAGDIKQAQNIFLYEISMLYTVLGLAYAQSHFAYPSLGSILAIHAEAYAKVQGFPKKLAAEDFHMLNKLRKTGEIKLLGGKPLLVSGRISERAPFGTGQAVKKQEEVELLFYNPQIFENLKEELKTDFFHKSANGPSARRGGSMVRQAHHVQKVGHPELVEGLETATPQLDRAAIYERSLIKQKDALECLQFIHQQQKIWPDLSYEEALEKAVFLKGIYSKEKSLDELRKVFSEAVFS